MIRNLMKRSIPYLGILLVIFTAVELVKQSQQQIKDFAAGGGALLLGAISIWLLAKSGDKTGPLIGLIGSIVSAGLILTRL